MVVADAGGRIVGRWRLTAVSLTALGGPLALGALYAPRMVSGLDGSAGFLALAAGAAGYRSPTSWSRWSRW